MSYSRNRTTESWNNDPNNFSNPSGPDNLGAGFQEQSGGYNDQQWSQEQESRPTCDPTDTSTWDTDSTGRRQRQSEYERDDTGNNWDSQGARGHWADSTDYGSTGTVGNTTNVNTVGAGGNAFGSDRTRAGGEQFGAGPQGGFRDGDNWHRSQDAASAGEKPGLGQKAKGTVEKLADRITGRE